MCGTCFRCPLPFVLSSPCAYSTQVIVSERHDHSTPRSLIVPEMVFSFTAASGTKTKLYSSVASMDSGQLPPGWLWHLSAFQEGLESVGKPWPLPLHCLVLHLGHGSLTSWGRCSLDHRPKFVFIKKCCLSLHQFCPFGLLTSINGARFGGYSAGEGERWATQPQHRGQV